MTTRAYRTFSLDRAVDVFKLSIDDAGQSVLRGFTFVETTLSSALSGSRVLTLLEPFGA
jgi:hypothetical protein